MIEILRQTHRHTHTLPEEEKPFKANTRKPQPQDGHLRACLSRCPQTSQASEFSGAKNARPLSHGRASQGTGTRKPDQRQEDSVRCGCKYILSGKWAHDHMLVRRSPVPCPSSPQPGLRLLRKAEGLVPCKTVSVQPEPGNWTHWRAQGRDARAGEQGAFIPHPAGC